MGIRNKYKQNRELNHEFPNEYNMGLYKYENCYEIQIPWINHSSRCIISKGCTEILFCGVVIIFLKLHDYSTLQ